MNKYNVSYVYDQAVLVISVDADNELDAQLLASTIQDEIKDGGAGAIDDIK